MVRARGSAPNDRPPAARVRARSAAASVRYDAWMLSAAALLLLAALPRQARDGPEPDSLWEAGRRAEAHDALARQLEATPQDAALRAQLAQRQLSVQRYAAALETLAPLGPDVDPARGTALYFLARYEEALPKLRADDPQQIVMRLESLLALGRESEAEPDLRAASELLGAQDARVLGYRARSLAHQGQAAQAIPLFRAVLEADPWNAAALFGLGRALIAVGEREEGLAVLEHHRALVPLLDQLDFAQRNLDLAPLHAPNLALLGDAERALGRLERAQAAYERALALATGEDLVPIALRYARLLAEDRDQLDQAVSALEAAALRQPDARLYVRAGDLLRAAGRWTEGLQRYHKAREQRPDDAAIAQRIQSASDASRGELPK